MYVIEEAFLDGESCQNCTWTEQQRLSDPKLPPDQPEDMWKRASNGSLDRLSPLQCFNEYATALQSNRGNVLIISDSFSARQGLRAASSGLTYQGSSQMTYLKWTISFSSENGTNPSTAGSSYSWVCDGAGSCPDMLAAIRDDIIKRRPKDKPPSPPQWLVSGRSVKYCLSEPAPPHCRLHYDRAVGTVVTMLNFCK